VFSNLGPQATQLISWEETVRNFAMPLILLGHFAEGGGEHYVCLQAPTENFITKRLFVMDSLPPDDYDINLYKVLDDYDCDDHPHSVSDESSRANIVSRSVEMDHTIASNDSAAAETPILLNEPLTGLELSFLVLNLIIDYACAIDISFLSSLRNVCKYSI